MEAPAFKGRRKRHQGGPNTGKKGEGEETPIGDPAGGHRAFASVPSGQKRKKERRMTSGLKEKKGGEKFFFSIRGGKKNPEARWEHEKGILRERGKEGGGSVHRAGQGGETF